MAKILVIGASGWIGGRIVGELLTRKYDVRCLARDPSKISRWAEKGCEVVQGDVADQASLQRATEGIGAVFVAIHTMSPQPGSTPDQRFMAVELNGLENIVSACKVNDTRRMIYVTSLGIASDAASEWLRERWRAEQFLLKSSLDVTVIRPGMIVGAGGRGFEALVGQAKKSTAIFLGGNQKMRTIAVDDLIYYIIGVLNGNCSSPPPRELDHVVRVDVTASAGIQGQSDAAS